MVKTKKRKKVRKNTRVFRCVQKVKKTRKIGAAIAICQSSTKQNYRTGRRLKNKKTKKGGTRPRIRPRRSRRRGGPLTPWERRQDARERERLRQRESNNTGSTGGTPGTEEKQSTTSPGTGATKQGGSKSKKVKSLTKIFQQYPDIFPSGYFRFLGARLQNHIDKKTLWYKNGVILTWIKYQKTVKKTPKCIIKPGDVKLDQIVNKNQGNGAGKKLLSQFLRKFEKNRIWLEVRANNKRAIRFYRDRGFKKVCNIKFGEIPGIMMVKN